MRVFAHLRTVEKTDYNPLLEFAQIPSVGEYFATGATSPWYRVDAVVHCPFEHADYAAEVYASQVEARKLVDNWHDGVE